MIRLYLNETQVFPMSRQTITVTKENPYFTMSDSYTLDVEIPLDIPQNRRFFGSIERMDASKRFLTYDAMMVSSVGVLINGKARLTKSTATSVMLQLTAGVSAVKAMADVQDLYIDEMILDDGKVYKAGTGEVRLDEGMAVMNPAFGADEPSMGVYGIPFYDSVNGIAVNIVGAIRGTVGSMQYPLRLLRKYVSMCPKLIDVIKTVFYKLGFVVDTSELPSAVESIYIVTGIHSRNVAPKLPHWTVAKFVEEVQNFLACSFVDVGNGRLKVVGMAHYKDGETVEINPADSFEVEYSENEDVKGVINCNLEYAIDGGDDETVSEEILSTARETVVCPTKEWAGMLFIGNSDDALRRRTVYRLQGGAIYVGWDNSLRRVAPFNPLDRYPDAETVTLNIVPAAMCEGYEHEISGNGAVNRMSINIPSVSNPLPVIERPLAEEYDDELPTLQDLISGGTSDVAGATKGDVMPVVFIGQGRRRVSLHHLNSNNTGQVDIDAEVALGFTDYDYKPEIGMEREKWSFSLQKLNGYDFTIGQLHDLGFEVNRKCRQVFKFVADRIPEATRIFVCRGKKYACEKLEIRIEDGEVDKLVTGYFYELLV